MDEQVPGAVALLLGLLMVVCGAAVSLVNRRAADGRLGRNAVAGIRIGATLRSDAAWRAGHAAAQGPSDVSGAVFAVTGLVAMVVRDAPWFAGVLLVGAHAGLVPLLVGVRRAVVAARGADGP
jgi:hypothetical protein